MYQIIPQSNFVSAIMHRRRSRMGRRRRRRRRRIMIIRRRSLNVKVCQPAGAGADFSSLDDAFESGEQEATPPSPNYYEMEEQCATRSLHGNRENWDLLSLYILQMLTACYLEVFMVSVFCCSLLICNMNTRPRQDLALVRGPLTW